MARRTCKGCGARVAVSASVCSACGSVLDAEDVETTPAPHLSRRRPNVIVVKRDMPAWAIVALTCVVIFVVLPVVLFVLGVWTGFGSP